MDVRDTPWNGSTGMTLKAEWDGHGMQATNSHAFTFRDYPATRMAWPGTWRAVFEATGGIGSLGHTAPFLGIIDAAMRHMRDEFVRRGQRPADFRAFEKMEWTHAHREAALLYRCHEAALTAVERTGGARHEAALAKANISVLAKSVMIRLCRIAGGGAYARHSPLGFWFEDVRAAGFLRPPWGIAYDGLFEVSWDNEPGRWRSRRIDAAGDGRRAGIFISLRAAAPPTPPCVDFACGRPANPTCVDFARGRPANPTCVDFAHGRPANPTCVDFACGRPANPTCVDVRHVAAPPTPRVVDFARGRPANPTCMPFSIHADPHKQEGDV